VFTVSLGGVGWNIKKLSTTSVRYAVIDSTDTRVDITAIDKVNLQMDTADVEITYGAEFSVTYPQLFTLGGKPATKIKTFVNNGVLSVKSEAVWHRTVGLFNFDDGTVKVVLPRDRNVDLMIEIDTGDVKFIGDASTKTNYVSVETDTGDVTMQDVIVTTIKIETDTGDVKLIDSKGELAQFEVDTGSVKLSSCEIGELNVETDTGDIKITDGKFQNATLRTDTGDVKLVGEVAIAKASIKTDTGDVGGKSGILDTSNIKITTSTGDIRLTLLGKKEDFSFLINVRTGDTNVNSMMLGDKLFEAKVSTGNVKLYFAE